MNKILVLLVFLSLLMVASAKAECSDSVCMGEIDGVCIGYVPVATPGVACSTDNDACTTDVCGAIGVCDHTTISCDDANPDTFDGCDIISGCYHLPTSCDDGDACTTDFPASPTFGCLGANVPIFCNDNNVLTTDTCNPVTGCVFTTIQTPCNDGNACTINDYDVQFVGCVGTPIVCNDNNAGTTDTCAPASGCVYTPLDVCVPSAEVCGDGVDNDCNDIVDDLDLDGDGFLNAACGGDDCDDDDEFINPVADEIVANGVDDDCTGQELCYVDADNDGYRPDGSSTVTSNDLDCTDSGEAISADPTLDCDDTDYSVNPGATEIPGDIIDQNCDGSDSVTDTDGDGTPDATDSDDDNDGVLDGPDVNDLNPQVCDDSDGDVCDDCSQNPTSSATSNNEPGWPLYFPSVLNDGPDSDGDGICDSGDSQICGNDILETGEECDDGNVDDGDGCGATCQSEVAAPICGNGIVEVGEECDDDILNGATICGCQSTCTLGDAGMTCTVQSCSGSTYFPQETCDGLGTCTDSGSLSCNPYICGLNSCLTTCVTNSDCTAGYSCDSSVCILDTIEEECNGEDDDGDGLVDEGFLDTNVDGEADCVDNNDDGDAWLDASDNCPLISTDNQLNTDGTPDGGDACDPDDDNDGVLDGVDNCIITYNAGQEDVDLDGIGDACDGCVATTEVYDLKDNDCDGLIDELEPNPLEYYTKTELSSTWPIYGASLIGFSGTWVDSTVTDALEWLYLKTVDLQTQIDNIELIPGPQGPVGPQGPQGVNGLPGADGPQGEPGDQGLPGQDGDNGFNCWDLNMNYMDDSEEDINGDKLFNVLDCQGAKGDKGDTGTQGIPGVDGKDGLAGPQGIQGEKGDTGDVGPAGADGAVGPQGDTGPMGPQGIPGADGLNGEDGKAGLNGIHCWDLNLNGLPDIDEDITDDGFVDVYDCQGIKGETGPKGDKGDTGDVGSAGADGAVGPQGDTGPMGPQGIQGIPGVDGLNGTDGAVGPQGEIGPIGPQGEQGIPGEKGDTGPAGTEDFTMNYYSCDNYNSGSTKTCKMGKHMFCYLTGQKNKEVSNKDAYHLCDINGNLNGNWEVKAVRAWCEVRCINS